MSETSKFSDLPEEVVRQIRQDGRGLLVERIPHGTRQELKDSLVDDGIVFEDPHGHTLTDMLSLEPHELHERERSHTERIKHERQLAKTAEQEQFLSA